MYELVFHVVLSLVLAGIGVGIGAALAVTFPLYYIFLAVLAFYWLGLVVISDGEIL